MGGGGLRLDLPLLSFRIGSCLRPPEVEPEGWPVCSSAGHHKAGSTSTDRPDKAGPRLSAKGKSVHAYVGHHWARKQPVMGSCLWPAEGCARGLF